MITGKIYSTIKSLRGNFYDAKEVFQEVYGTYTGALYSYHPGTFLWRSGGFSV